MNEEETKIILGIDPGSNLLGYAFLQVAPHYRKPVLVTMGTLDMRAQDDHLSKLKQIFEELNALVKLYAPSDAAIEAPFYGKDAQAMLKLGRAQGVAMITVAMHGLNVTEYSPRSIKKAVTGKGGASKEQVAAMLPHLVDGDINYKYLDASDALGVAFCHYLSTSRSPIGGKKYSDWGSFLKDNPNLAD